MANIAVIFHWPLSEMTSLTVSELDHWQELARKRSGNQDD